jgi:hypothetical protein
VNLLESGATECDSHVTESKMHHFAWTSAPTVVQINLEGPFDLFYVNPADNPQPKTSQQ